ncbi:hypothetical protein [Hymenobacter actinosclerus]|uniref:hypothetical protein n=1 Tax=Hymenobacter actinosclerus TaxID=82805 RepID=UPI00116098EE|nr:hypothetical protein [Hymenobacter actinosclerus]
MRSDGISDLTVLIPLKPSGANHLRQPIKLIDGNLSRALLVGTRLAKHFLFSEGDEAPLAHHATYFIDNVAAARYVQRF